MDQLLHSIIIGTAITVIHPKPQIPAPPPAQVVRVVRYHRSIKHQSAKLPELTEQQREILYGKDDKK